MLTSLTSVLIFDSNPLSLKILQAMLNRLELTPTIASDISDVVPLCESQRFQLVFLDYHELTPEMEHTLHTLSHSATCKPELLVTLSTELSAETLSLLQSHGVNQCLFRPVHFDDIQSCVETAASGTSGSASSRTSLIDMVQLNEMADDWDESFCELLTDFLTDVKDMFKQLCSLNQSESYDEATRMAHSMKGSGANFGMIAFSNSMATAEQTLSHSKTLSDQFITESKALLDESIQFIELEIQKH